MVKTSTISQLPSSLIRTRFHQPVLPSDYVARLQLIDRLNRDLDRPLTLVSAPAGYGKSILVSAWMKACPRPSTWLALDASLSDFAVFLSYFVNAIHTIAPAALARTEAMMTGFTLPSFDALADSLINELDEIGSEFVVVLEDYHTIHTAEVHDLLAYLLRHPIPHMHLVIISRQDPPLALSRLRAHALVSEVRIQDLRFSAAESATFVQKVLGYPLPEAALEELMVRTEGWAVGLRLVALALRYKPDASPMLTSVQGAEHDRYLADYLMSEVLAQIAPERVDFLLLTAILDQMCAPLCNALLGRVEEDTSSQLILEWLEQANLFTTPLDGERRWYRYHHLLQSFLQNQLEERYGPQELVRLHVRASTWYAEHGFLEDALRHALLGKDMPAAARLLAANRHALMDAEQWQVIGRMLGEFPATAVAADPDLTLMQAWMVRLANTDLEPVVELLGHAERLIEQMVDRPEHATYLRGELDCLRLTVIVETIGDPASMIALGRRALATTPRTWYFIRAVAWLWLALAYQMAGDLETAHAVLSEGQVEDIAPDGAVRARIAGSRSFLAWIAGDLRAIPAIAGHLTTVGETYRQAESMG